MLVSLVFVLWSFPVFIPDSYFLTNTDEIGSKNALIREFNLMFVSIDIF